MINLVICALITATDAGRILAVFPTPSISHQVVFRPLTEELAKRGHEVIVITPDPAFTEENLPANLIEIDVHNISYEAWRKEFFRLNIGDGNYLLSQSSVAFKLFAKVFEAQMKEKEVQKVLDTGGRFDLLLLEACVRPTLALSHIFKSPVIQVSSFGPMFGTNEIAGVTIHPIFYPSVISQRIFNLTIWEKIREFYYYYKIEKLYKSFEPEENELIRKFFGPEIPPLSKLYDNIDMFFLNIDPIWANNQPIPSNIVYIGGIHQKPGKELPKDLQTYLNSSKYDVIYVSFGTNVHSSQVPLHIVESMVETFGQLKYSILWKWDDDKIKVSENVKIYKWLPQMDLLRHPKVKLFITQGGLQSTQEAILAGVPLIGVPSLGDQWHNTEKYVYHKIGLKLAMNSLTAKSFKEAILTIIEDESPKPHWSAPSGGWSTCCGTAERSIYVLRQRTSPGQSTTNLNY
ncbi:UDP-glucosyltransferase 2-like isoform X2 [Epargyreus clarus]|uniref:UDP-glucosyltransferase 2-like isoform X2 n=1 Tax=Epargyreus clarus TaxID=520877 RepID=UPI003C2AD068